MTTRCIVVPPSPINPTPSDAVDFKVDNNNNSPSPQKPDEDSLHVEYYQEPQETCASESSGSESYYTRNRNTTRSWPVIYRNNSLQNSNNYLEPNNQTKTEQLQARNEQQKRKSTHQYDFDQIFGLNNANYQQYLATHRKSSNFDFSSTYFDKSPSIYDMQQHTGATGNQNNSEQTQTGGVCNAPPTIILLLLTLIMTTSKIFNFV